MKQVLLLLLLLFCRAQHAALPYGDSCNRSTGRISLSTTNPWDPCSFNPKSCGYRNHLKEQELLEHFTLFWSVTPHVIEDQHVKKAERLFVYAMKNVIDIWSSHVKDRCNADHISMIKGLSKNLMKTCIAVCDVGIETNTLIHGNDLIKGNHFYIELWFGDVMHYYTRSLMMHTLPLMICLIRIFEEDIDKQNVEIERCLEDLKRMMPQGMCPIQPGAVAMDQWYHIASVFVDIELEKIPDYVAAKEECIDAFKNYLDVFTARSAEYVAEKYACNIDLERDLVHAFIACHVNSLHDVCVDLGQGDPFGGNYKFSNSVLLDGTSLECYDRDLVLRAIENGGRYFAAGVVKKMAECFMQTVLR